MRSCQVLVNTIRPSFAQLQWVWDLHSWGLLVLPAAETKMTRCALALTAQAVKHVVGNQ